jgi:hypothetical protein
MNRRFDSQPQRTAVAAVWMKPILVYASALIVAAAVGASAAHARPFSYTYKNKYAEFEFSWSTEAAAIPALVARLRSDLAEKKAKTIRGGREEYGIREQSGSPGVGWQSVTKITTNGETPRLLSLSRQYYAFTGGAHGNGATTGLLWDRKLGKEIKFSYLFSSPSHYLQLLRTPYCRALDKERKNRRGPDYQPGSVPEFDSCPKLSELALVPAATKRGGKLNEIHLLAAPYAVGSYAEGEYEIALPVTRQLIAALKPQYRDSFKAQLQ